MEECESRSGPVQNNDGSGTACPKTTGSTTRLLSKINMFYRIKEESDKPSILGEAEMR
jgi:hypothetical protein